MTNVEKDMLEKSFRRKDLFDHELHLSFIHELGSHRRLTRLKDLLSRPSILFSACQFLFHHFAITLLRLLHLMTTSGPEKSYPMEALKFYKMIFVALISLAWVPLSHGFIVQPHVVVNAKNKFLLPLRAHPSDELDVTFPYLATCIPGLAGILAEELSEIHPDITDITPSGNAAVTFQATRKASLHALCWLRTAHRLLEQVATSPPDVTIYDRDGLLDFVKDYVNVKDLLGDGAGGLLTLSVKAILNNPRQLPQDLSHSHFTALTVKNALCDVVRDIRGDRPNVDVETPDVPLVVMLKGTSSGATVAVYRSLHPPGSLHKRGYRKGSAIHKAAMKESLAAGLLREAGWHKKVKEAKQGSGSVRLVDPMAGSGSFVLEAAMMASDIAPGLMRIKCGVPDHSLPPVTRWKSNIDASQIWKSILTDAASRARTGLQWMKENPKKVTLHANDIHPGALEIMESSLEAAGLRHLIQITNLDCYDMEPLDSDADQGHAPYLVVTNPPWGIRLTEDIEDSWEGLRHYLRDVCPSGTEAWVLSGDKDSTKLLKLRRDRMIPIQTGEQTLRWIQYTIGREDSAKQMARPPTKQKPQTRAKVAQQDDSW